MQNIWLSAFYALIGCLGFCFVYNLRGYVMLMSVLGGAIGWLVYLLFSFTGSDIFQYFFATIVIAVYSELMARLFRTPVTVFLIIALLPLVPGGWLYYTMEYCIEGNTAMFLQEGLHTFFIAGALALGILVVSAVMRLAQRIWDAVSEKDGT